ncbi:MAG: HAMP domain-containing sensor histidine kinase [Bacteroidota bacterium]
MKTQTKLAIILGLISIVLVILFGATIYYSLNKFSYLDFYKRLQARVSIAAQYNLSVDDLNNTHLIALRTKHLEKLEKEQEYIIELLPQTTLNNIADTYKLPLDFIETLTKNGNAESKKGNILYAGAKHQKLNKQYLVIVSAENYYVSHHLSFVRNILIAGISMVILIVAAFSVYFSKSIFYPIKNITDKVKQISTQNIHLRLESNYATSNEISELTNTFNGLLDRVETAFETQKNFISNASHELGTPLTAIIGEADVTLLKERNPGEYIKAIQNILQQAERLNEITQSLLFLAQTGYKGQAITFERIRMDEIIWETKTIIDRLNPNNKIMVDLSLLPEDPTKLKLAGNKQLLNLAFANILNNACKYSNNKPVTVQIASSNTYVIVSIQDNGIGIPKTDIPFIYDPFFRASNTTLFEGYGIGLPLTRNIIHLHKGQLLVSSVQNEGTTVQIKIPVMVI